MSMGELLYEGKAKRVFATDDPDVVIQYFKDDATAFNALKKGTIAAKGILNQRISAHLFEVLAAKGIVTHYIETLSTRQMKIRKVSIIPLEVVVRNRVAGSLAKRLGREEGEVLAKPLIEFYYKDDALGDPLVCADHAIAFGWATAEEIVELRVQAATINGVLKERLAQAGIDLIDFKLEFGKTRQGEILLADEISPDTCRYWDVNTGEKLDKDRFRRDLGGVEEAYLEVARRLGLPTTVEED
ncbi:MAG: phosphoribosylaminoimidazolesuccinocarboxamide synthase [Alphaproteobacteria bacterium CG_4_10_14_0_2_um_filter_63_37]|nr:MAG: phosphoribosylaminoimidazolesuccinocarboxamide synthase [Proteobacteria bacterium CG1_02_64_396]PJA23954.1 MAG: phosphoribosylaminoimidazolesuccinocarboxamide synthase [Alphaproteobacteria bacterium CG_4_10_14_0_2_um_filter_63_37]